MSRGLGFFFFKQKTAYEIMPSLVGSEMCIRDSIGTIQLGATVDYAILMTNRYKLERSSGKDKKAAAGDALKATMKSVMVSAFTFFGATFGVGVYSSIDMISSLCLLMARGAIVSMLCVICILPAMYIVFDKAIVKLSLIHISEPTRLGMISYAVFCLKKKKQAEISKDVFCLKKKKKSTHTHVGA